MISLPASTVAFSFGSKPRIDREVTDFPLPDSPTSATVAFWGISKVMPLTASKVVCLSRRKLTRRLRTDSRGSLLIVSGSLFKLGIERVAQRIGEQTEGGDQERHGRARRRQLPPLAEDQLVLRLIEHRAPRHDVDRNAETEERQDHLGLDERHRENRKLDERDVTDIGENVHEDTARVRRADGVGRLHVFAPLVLQVLTANQPKSPGPAGQPQNQDDG